MIRSSLISLVALALVSGSAAAQTAIENETFDHAVKAFTKSGRARVYQCKGPSGAFNQEDHHPTRLVTIAKAMSAGSEAEEARRSGCRLSNNAGPSDAFSGLKVMAQAAQDQEAVWLIGEVAENYPQSTGYVFEAIVRIPLSPKTAAAPPSNSVAAKADAKFYSFRHTRTISTSDESGFFSCPTDAALTGALNAASRLSATQRDLHTADILKKARCLEGKGTITNIKVNRLVEGESVTWHGATATIKGRQALVVFWLF